jgi:Fungal fucose-specific lectin
MRHASTGSAIQEYVNGNPWVKGATLSVALTGTNIAAVTWQENGPHLRVYYQDPAHNLKEHAYDGSWYVGKKS